MKGIWFYLIILFLACFIVVAEDVPISGFTIWNMTPLIISLVIYLIGIKQGGIKNIYGAYGFLIGSMLLSGYIHLAWLFGWGNIHSGSTAGLIFIFIPIYSLITGAIGYGMGRATANNKSNSTTTNTQ